ncbi:collagen alpha-2(I) chain isoform X3 [Cyprinodon tularosa]|uniref:collagen alpha-2(I) chain isoform X3 n=1 Tax=Cyprinodon tularosa TaxID=77115 RepID=UPI0018E20F0E|nr:collagen alpha-2(I) chain isoform X3 [Cyprinodon tularosa]
MLPPNLLIVSIVILLATTASTAPVEEKEVEEVETEATEMLEGEVSEEEEDDDDDSKSQDNFDGALGAQKTTMSAPAAGGSALSGQALEAGPHVGAAGSSTGQGVDLSPVQLAAAGPPNSSSGSAVSPGSEGSMGSAASVGSTGSVSFLGPAGSAGSPGSVDSMGSAASVGSAGSVSFLGPAGSAGSQGSVGSMGFAGSVDSAGPVDSGGSLGSVGSAGFVELGGSPGSVPAEISGVSAGQTHSAGAERLPSSSRTDVNGPDGVDSESNGNGQKLLNGGGAGAGVESQTGIIDPSSHDYLHNLMGGGLVDVFSTDGHVEIPAHLTHPTHHVFSGIGTDVTVVPSGGQIMVDSPADSHHHSAGSIDQSASHGASLSPGSDQPMARPFSGSSHSIISSTSLLGSAIGGHQEQTDRTQFSDHNGNGRQTMLTDTNRAVTERMSSLGDAHTQNLLMQTDLTGGTETVTALHLDLTNSGPGRDITELSPITMNIESAAAVTNTLSPVSAVGSNTDPVTVMADSTGTDTVTAHPSGTPFDSRHLAGTDQTQMAGSVTEQYNPSGQGPEGAENAELEDTC